MSHQFDRYSTNYDDVLNAGLRVTGDDKDYFAAARVRWTARQLAALGAAARTVLDFGCGTGATAPILARELRAARVIGVDESRASIDEARRLHASDVCSFVHAAQSIEDATCDVAYVNGVLHHVASLDQPRVLATIRAALRPGGMLALWENNPANPGTRWVMRRLPFDRDAVMLWPSRTRRLVERASFSVVAIDYCFFFPRPLAALRVLEPSLRSVPLGGQYVVFARRPDLGPRE
jgi:SAM-dependent methyltransferase